MVKERMRVPISKRSKAKGEERAHIFGRELRLARIRAGLLQSDLGEKLGVHGTSVSQWERGNRADVPSLETVRQLDTVLAAGGVLLRAAGYLDEEVDGEVPTVTEVPLLSVSPREARLLVALGDRLRDELERGGFRP